MRDALEAILCLAVIAVIVYVAAKLRFLLGVDQVPWMGTKKIQTLFGDDSDQRR